MIIKPLAETHLVKDRFTVFLAGSIEMDTAENWQEIISESFLESERICLLNPRRDEWNSEWKQEIENEQFYKQVTWELDALEQADLIIFYFAPGTKSPISLLELGLFARSNKIVVCCPDGFWRKGNIDIVCERYGIQQVNSLKTLIQIINQQANEHQSTHAD